MSTLADYMKPVWTYRTKTEGEWAWKIDMFKLASFFPKQLEAFETSLRKKYTLYGGTKGAGKSRWIRFAMIWHLVKIYQETGVKGVRGGIFCEDYPSLKDRHITKIAEEFPAGLGKFYTNHKEHGLCYILSDIIGGGVIAFRNLDDVSKYESSEFAIVAIDELQKDPLKTFSVLRTRMRWPGIGARTRFIGGAIPGGEPYITQYWIDRQFPPEEKEADEFAFIHALPNDNPFLASDYYSKNLASLTAAEHAAYAEGDFHAFDGIRDDEGWEKLLSHPQIVTAQMDREIVMGTGLRILGVDPGGGGDESAMVERTDTVAEVLFNEKTKDTMNLIPIITKLQKERGHYDVIAVDIVGIGRGVYDRMVELGWINVIGVSGGAAPTNQKVEKAEFGKKTYQNMRAQVFDKARTWVLRGGKLIRNIEWNQLGVIPYKTSSDFVMKIMSKDEMRKKGIRSPNVADAFSLTFAEEDEQLIAMRNYQQQEEARTMGMETDKPKPTGFGFVDA